MSCVIEHSTPKISPPILDPSAPIGIFDSGIGGLTVARAIMDQLPHESILYIGDTANGPYGPLPIAQVREYALQIADDLVDRGCKMIVIACNTASAAFLRDARERYSIPIVEVILPAVRRAVSTTRNGKIGVIGTHGTINSGAYQDLFSTSPSIEAHAVACPRFVEFVEQGMTAGPEVLQVATDYLEKLRLQAVDTLVLGCTHYPLLSGVIQLVMGDRVTLVSSAEETAKDVLRILSQKELLVDPKKDSLPLHTFESSGDPVLFSQLGQCFLGPIFPRTSISSVE